jgi:hypothetical protein
MTGVIVIKLGTGDEDRSSKGLEFIAINLTFSAQWNQTKNDKTQGILPQEYKFG